MDKTLILLINVQSGQSLLITDLWLHWIHLKVSGPGTLKLLGLEKCEPFSHLSLSLCSLYIISQHRHLSNDKLPLYRLETPKVNVSNENLVKADHPL